MTLNISTASGISQRTNLYAERQMLKYAGPHLVLERFGKHYQMPKNKSRTMKLRRPQVFDAQAVPLAEGVTPTASAFSYEDVTVTLNQYGQIAQVTDVIEDTHEDPVLNDIVQQLGDNIGRTREALDYAVLKAATNAFFANGTQRTDVNTPISLTKIRAVVRALKQQKAMKFTQVLGPGPDYGTVAIEPAYVCVVHVDVEADIRNIPGFAPTSDYARQGSLIHEHEFGKVEDVRFVCSADLSPIADAGGAKGSMVSTTGTSADIYPCLFFGKEAWGHVMLRGMGSVSPSIIPVGQKTKDDPLGQRGVAGWKFYHGAVILNQAWMATLEVAVTDL